MVERFSPRAVARLVVGELRRIAREVDAAVRAETDAKAAAGAEKKASVGKLKEKDRGRPEKEAEGGEYEGEEARDEL